jgi:uncharacterized protein DUF3467
MSEKPVNMTFEIKPEFEGGVYSNVAAVVHSPNEFIFDFAMAVPGKDSALVRARVVTSPQHAKQFLMALQENIINYERVNGEIQVGRPVAEVVSRTTH